MLNVEQIKRLNEITFHKHSKQKVLLYLLADNFTMDDIISMKVNKLKGIELHSEYDIFKEEMLYDLEGGYAFRYPGGNKFKVQDVYRIIRQATNRVMSRPLKIVEFVEYVRKG